MSRPVASTADVPGTATDGVQRIQAGVLIRRGGRAQLQALTDRGGQRLGPAQRNSARRLREIGREAVMTADEIRDLLD